jgi:hypothetical protein
MLKNQAECQHSLSIATESTEEHGKNEHPLDMFSVFFRGFRGHTIRHHQFETALAGIRAALCPDPFSARATIRMNDETRDTR